MNQSGNIPQRNSRTSGRTCHPSFFKSWVRSDSSLQSNQSPHPAGHLSISTRRPGPIFTLSIFCGQTGHCLFSSVVSAASKFTASGDPSNNSSSPLSNHTPRHWPHTSSSMSRYSTTKVWILQTGHFKNSAFRWSGFSVLLNVNQQMNSGNPRLAKARSYCLHT